MDGGEKQDEMTRRLKAQVKQGKEKQRDRDYVQVLNIGGPLPDAANAAPAGFDGISAVDAFKELDVDFTMIYMDQVFPFLFPFYAPSKTQGGRAWVLDILRHNKTMFHAIMNLSTYFFTLVLSNEDVGDYQVCRQNIWIQLEGYASDAIKSLQTEVLAMNQQGSTTLLQRARAMESIAQPMVIEMAMAKTNESSIHLTAATSLFEDILEASKVNGGIDMTKTMAGVERPSWVPLTTQRPVWNTEQAALRFYFAIFLWADIVSSTSLQILPRFDMS
ncbi:hypothetical protein NW765_006994 [Fusarium oxysporum]|nr:hypothetical protein NW765_006994 [Fusarium oxysporum]